MSQLSEIEPKEKSKLIELVKKAGVNVSNWANYKRGKKWAAANPKYCYEWSFIQANKVVVLNLWHDLMEERENVVVMRRNMNMREIASTARGMIKVRARNLDNAIQTAINDKLPIRVVICKRNSTKPSKVSKRGLDAVTWAVTTYDWNNGQCGLTRGFHQKNVSEIENKSAVDDLSDIPKGNPLPDRAERVTQVIMRDPHVRAHVKKRAKGKCEYCKARGFITTDGSYYVETHHIILLCKSGSDTIENVIALCPQHHRQAHYGKEAESLEAEFIRILKRLNV